MSARQVSVVMPAYNAERFIAKAIDSVRAQTHAEIELFVIDDASTDRTVQVAREIATADPRVIVLANQGRKGPSGGRNTGIKHARGTFLAFLDADDLWLPTHLEQALAVLDRHAAVDAVMFDSDIVDVDTGARLGTWFSHRRLPRGLASRPLDGGAALIEADMVAALIDESFLHVQSLVLRRQERTAALFDESVRAVEDRDWAIRLSRAGTRFAWDPRVTSIYHRHGHSLTTPTPANQAALLKDELRLFAQYRDWPSLPAGLRSKIQVGMSQRYLELAYWQRFQGRYSEAFHSLRQSGLVPPSRRQLIELGKLAIATLLRRPAAHG